ncbi:MAG: hypothetical protein OXM61_17185 [Candidatus Poribacteria bacterium]|nr:hypothetical protein [Candidatus Poribacteria bacterium]
MMNVRINISGIMGMLFIFSLTSTGLAQESQQSDSSLSESDTVMLIKEIHNLDTKLTGNFHTLDKNLGILNLKTNFLLGILTVIAVPIVVSFLSTYLQNRLSNRNNAQLVSEITSRVIAQISAEQNLGENKVVSNDKSEKNIQAPYEPGEEKPDE